MIYSATKWSFTTYFLQKRENTGRLVNARFLFRGSTPRYKKRAYPPQAPDPAGPARGAGGYPAAYECGEESVPLVKPGDLVEVGQPIAGPGPGGAAVHASVSGRVSAIREQPHPWGGQSVAVVIRNDGQDTPWSGRPEPVILEEVTLDLLLDRCGRLASWAWGRRGPHSPKAGTGSMQHC